MSKLKDFWHVTKEAFRAWMARNPLRDGAVVAYFAVFSVPGLIVLLVNLAALVVEKEKIRAELSRLITNSINPSTARHLEEVVAKAGDLQGGWVSTAVSIVIILFAATRVFVHLQITLNSIWKVKRTKSAVKTQLRKSLFSVVLILVLSCLLLLSMVFSALVSSFRNQVAQVFPGPVLLLLQVAEMAVFLLLVSSLFALMFKYLPDVKLKWRTVLGGAVLTGVLFILLKYALSMIIAKLNPASVYGAAGSVVLVMLWFAVAAMILFFGAEFCRQHAIVHHHPVKARPGAEFTGHDPVFEDQ